MGLWSMLGKALGGEVGQQAGEQYGQYRGQQEADQFFFKGFGRADRHIRRQREYYGAKGRVYGEKAGGAAGWFYGQDWGGDDE